MSTAIHEPCGKCGSPFAKGARRIHMNDGKSYHQSCLDGPAFELHERAHKAAHAIFACIDCFAYTGDGRTHSENCKRAAREIAREFER